MQVAAGCATCTIGSLSDAVIICKRLATCAFRSRAACQHHCTKHACECLIALHPVTDRDPFLLSLQDLSWARPALKWEGVLEEVKYGTGRTKAASVAVPVMMTIPGPVPAVSYAPTTRPAADLTFGPAKTGGAPSAPGAAAPASNGNGASAAPKPAAAPLKYTYSSRPASGAASPAAPASNGTSSSNGGAVPTPARQVTKPMVGARTTKSE